MDKKLEKMFLFSEKASNQLDQVNSFLTERYYNNYYGGSYIDVENEQLFVMFTNKNENIDLDVKQICKSSNVVIKTVKYSLSDLQKIVNEISSQIAENETLSNAIAGYGIIERYNAVQVELLESKINEEAFRKMFPNLNDAVKVVMVSSLGCLATNIVAGAGMGITGHSFYGTISFCANKPNSGRPIKGFVIAGHCGKLNENIYIDGSLVGTVTDRVYGDKYDSSFVAIENSSYVQSNILNGNYKITSSTSSYKVGSLLASFGVTSGVQTGTVESTSYTVLLADKEPNKKTRFTDVIQMKIGTQGGDSGGPLCNITSNTTCAVAGTMIGGTSVMSYHTKFSNISAGLNITLYT